MSLSRNILLWALKILGCVFTFQDGNSFEVPLKNLCPVKAVDDALIAAKKFQEDSIQPYLLVW